MLKHQIGKIIGGNGVVALHRKGLAIDGLRLLPVTFELVQGAERYDDLRVGRSKWNRALIIGDRSVGFSAGRLHRSDGNDGSRIRRLKFDGLGETLFSFRLLRTARLGLAQKISKGCVIGRTLKLFLQTFDGGSRLAPLEIQ